MTALFLVSPLFDSTVVSEFVNMFELTLFAYTILKDVTARTASDDGSLALLWIRLMTGRAVMLERWRAFARANLLREIRIVRSVENRIRRESDPCSTADKW